MYHVTDAFKTALTESHDVIVHADVVDNLGSVIDSFSPLGGGVNVEGPATIRRSTSGLTLGDLDGRYTPENLTDIFHPASGNRLKLYRGIKGVPAVDGATVDTPAAMVPIFTGPIYDVEIRDTGIIELDVTAYDNMVLIRDNRWTIPHVIPAGASVNLETEFRAIVADRLPGVAVSFGIAAPVRTLYAPWVFGADSSNDPSADLQKIVEALGGIMYFDVTGQELRVEPVPELAGTNFVFDYSENNNALLGVTRKLSKESMFNGCVVRGGTTAFGPYISIMWDVDPSSPTYYKGPFGRKPQFISSDAIPDQLWADIVCRAEMNKRLGQIEGASFDGLVNPAHEAFDPIRIGREKSKLNDAFLLDRFTIPLSGTESMPATCRARQGIAGVEV